MTKKKINSITCLFLILFVLGCTKNDIKVVKGEDIIVILPETTLPTSNPVVPTTNLEKSIFWIENMQSSNGLLKSSEKTDLVSLYDNSLAALVFMETNKFEQAEQIFDFFNSRINTELLHNTGGFYQFRNVSGGNGNRTWMGDNAWLLIALNNYHTITGSDKYQPMAEAIEQWLRGLQDTDGGLWGGKNEDGSTIPKVTEGMITAFNAVKGYDNFHKNILSYLKENRWGLDTRSLLAWPENPAYIHALDLHSLGSLIFEGYSSQNLSQAKRFYNTQVSTVNGLEISGYCFDEDKDVVWLEGTAQIATSYKFLKNDVIAGQLLAELEKSFINSSAISGAQGIPYTANHGTNYGPDILWDHADLTPALSATAWYIFAKNGYNPFKQGSEKKIPILDSFWTAETTNN